MQVKQYSDLDNIPSKKNKRKKTKKCKPSIEPIDLNVSLSY